MLSDTPIGLTVVAAMFCGFASGCVYEDMQPCPEDYGIIIKNDWGKAKNADPEGMAYIFFPKQETGSWRFDFPGKEAGEVNLPDGAYNFVSYNDDTAGIAFETTEDGIVFATTYESELPRKNPDGTKDPEPVMSEPDRLWGYGMMDVVVDSEGVEYGGRNHIDRVLESYPVVLTPHYTIEVRHVNNLQGVAALRGALTGQAYGVCVNTGVRSDKTVTVPFSLEMNPDSTLYATFHTFGIPEAEASISDVLIYFKLSDGRVVEFRRDMTRDILSSPDPLDIELVIDSISLPWAPPAEITGGAFDPSVKDWIEISINY